MKRMTTQGLRRVPASLIDYVTEYAFSWFSLSKHLHLAKNSQSKTQPQFIYNSMGRLAKLPALNIMLIIVLYRTPLHVVT